MKTTKLLLLLSAFQLVSISAFSQLTVSVTPGYRFNSGETISLSKLNQLGAPTVSVAGTVTGSSLAAGGVSAVHISTNAVDGITIRGGYDGSTTTNLTVNYNTGSLGIVAGALGVPTNSIDGTELATNFITLGHLTNTWLDAASVLTNLPATFNTNAAPYTNTFILIGTSFNVGTNGAPTNTTFKLTTLNAVQAGAVYSALNTNLINTLASNLLATSYTSTNTNALASGLVNFPHTLGATPRQLRVTLLCVTNDSPWLAGDELNADGIPRNGSSFANYSITANATNIAVRAYSAQPGPTDGASSLGALTILNWRLKVYAER